MLRSPSAICTRSIRGAAAAAVALAVTAGCTAQAVDRGPGAGKPGDVSPGGLSTSPVAAEPETGPPSPSASATRSPSASPSPSGEPGKSPSESPVPQKSSASPAPEILMRQGAKGDRVRELQARLAQIGWFDDTPTGFYGPVTATAVKGFQTKRGLPATGATDAVTWQRLLGMTTKPTRDELLGRAVRKPAGKPDPRCMKGRVLCISKTTRTLSWMNDGKVLSTMDVRFGSQYTPTREGVFDVYWKSRDHVSTLYDTPMPYAMFFSGGQAVHYSADFAARGYNGASHGCVNVRDKGKIAALFDQVRNGDKVVIYW
ncbi:L,D-transpeptidase family protein [Streptomyces sp. MUM 178J]|uniref:L,D-transpeptidase family protein n=1 Tax=Streptomyces sp. MUM 178J TaxID=2791991 RepID=UPI001F04E0E9|nr:L,D-transpeptidase family protein [Streptomyces sp. MUM 178J]WRQ81769.1 L,D-transpeptidase family protein [Streptomyces sp. MUM 178J]